MEFQPVEKVVGRNEFVPVKKAGALEVVIEPEVPEWGRENPNLYGLFGAGKAIQEQAVDPALKGTGLALGAMYGGIPGAALGYGMGKKTGEIIESGLDYIGGEKGMPKTISGELVKSGKDVIEGATIEMGGRLIPKFVEKGAKVIGDASSQVVGRLTGTGSTAVKEAFRSGKAATDTMFEKALRGKITGEEVVGIARNALSKIKDARQAQYQADFAKVTSMGNMPAIPGQPLPRIDVRPIGKKLHELLNQYNIKGSTDPKTGELIFDTSRVAMGKKGIGDIEEIVQKVSKWGKDPEDFTAKGLDILKRQLDDFYSDSSQARSFVTSLRNTVKDTIVKAVPEYAKMTKNYAEATTLIKDIESNLMMRKQGMSGRIVADQTLRRLMSAMKDNFELRKELVDLLGTQGGKDVVGAVAGHAMRSWVPRGLAGTGTALVGNVALAKFVSPAFIPVVAASSPRVSAEFVRMLGKYSAQVAGSSGAVGRVAVSGIIADDGEQGKLILPRKSRIAE